ncbi:MAG: hypothetical protein WCJ09_27325 [Planctomycetota bacterium]
MTKMLASGGFRVAKRKPTIRQNPPIVMCDADVDRAARSPVPYAVYVHNPVRIRGFKDK